jgi:hypothetical protein
MPDLEIILLGIYVALMVYQYHSWRDDYRPSEKWWFMISSVIGTLQLERVLIEYQVISLSNTAFIINKVVRLIIFLILIILIVYTEVYWRKWYKPPKKSLSEATKDELLWYYVWYAKEWGRACNSPSDGTEKIDELYASAGGIYYDLKRRGKLGALVPLLHHKDSGVQVLAGRHLLRIDELGALKALASAAQGKDEMANVAQAIIDYWKNGEIKPDQDFPNKT